MRQCTRHIQHGQGVTAIDYSTRAGATGTDWWVFRRVILVAAGVGLLLTGCSRERYRLAADREAYEIIAEKAADPRWQLPGYTIQVNPRSRMFDPAPPDAPPMPPDDPTSHQLMHRVDGKKGYPYWHAWGETPSVDTQHWRRYLPLDDNGVLTLDGAGAVRMALMHSPAYQQQLETLYLSALDFSAERFRFDTQFFGGTSADLSTAGRLAPGAGGASRSVLALDVWLGTARRFFTTGADLTVGLANSILWQLAGPETNSTTTLLDFTLIQPLLRRAGRDRVMETLTLAERTLLANVRQFELYRQGFYMDIMTGLGQQPGPTRRGGFFGTPGLGGFTGVGGGGFGGVGGAAFGGGGGAAGGGGAGAGTAGGFMGLLQTQQVIRNQQANIAALRSSLAQLEAFREAGRIDFFQVEQVRQQLYQSLSQLLTAKRAYQDALDAFKRDLGLPPDIVVQVEDPILDKFKLIDVEVVPVQNRITDLQRNAGQQILELLPEEPPLRWTDQLAQEIQRLIDYLKQLEESRQQVLRQVVPRVEADLDQLERSVDDRLEAAERLRALAQRARQQPALPGEERLIRDVDESLWDVSALPQLPEQLRRQKQSALQRIEEQGQANEKAQDQLHELLTQGPNLTPEALTQAIQEKVVATVPALIASLSADLLELSLIQARARAESITLVPVEMTWQEAVEIARRCRLDWMNARAALVDAWRLIRFNADSLESAFDIVFAGDVRNTGDNPLRLHSATGTLRVGVQFDAPLTRLLERNTYRQALIEYQQARRNYYRFEDGVATQLRAILRQIELNQVNFELRREALRVAVAQVESARLRLEEPPRQTQLEAGSAALGPTTAQNLLNALNALRGAQDDFLSVWVNYEVQRGLLDLSLGTMRLDEQGLWIDPGPIGKRFGYPNLELLGAEPWGEPPRDPETDRTLFPEQDMSLK